jgi:uncharacterized protein YggU (UPF0235/DUF167 family)
MLRVEQCGALLRVHVEPHAKPAQGDALVGELEAAKVHYTNRVVGGHWVIDVVATPRSRRLLLDLLEE